MKSYNKLINESNLSGRTSTGYNAWEFYITQSKDYKKLKINVEKDSFLRSKDGTKIVDVKKGQPLSILSDKLINVGNATLGYVSVGSEKGYLPLTAISKPITSKVSGAQWESIIVVAYNRLVYGISKDEAIKKGEVSNWQPKFDAALEIAYEIVENAFGSPSGTMKHFGAGSVDLTKEWDDYFIKMTGKKATHTTKTPKTDMYIGSEHISLKKAGGSQLMSGGKSETLATLAFAYDQMPSSIKTKEFEKGWKKLSKRIEKEFVSFKLPAKTSITTLKRDIKNGKTGGIIDKVKSVISNASEMTESINNILENPIAKMEVVQEAMTGRNKFADPLGAATHMMKFDEKGNGSYISIDKSLVKKYASNTSFSVSFKSSRSGSWIALKGIYSESTDLETIIEESCIKELDEMMLNEGIVSIMKDNFIVKFISGIIKRIWKKIKEYALKGLFYITQLFQISMTVNSPTIKI